MKEDIAQVSVSDVVSEIVVRRPSRRRRISAAKATSKVTRPDHYKVICISIYTRDLEQLEEKVAELKRRGLTKMNKSQLIRIALSQLPVENVALGRQG